MEKPILECKNIVYRYGGAEEPVTALKNVELTIYEHEFIGLMGHTGSGKSTLTQLLNGLEKPYSGTVLFHGEDIHKKGFSLRELRSRVGLVFQYPEYQLFESTIIEDVSFGPKNSHLPAEEVLARAKKALTLVGIPESYYERSPFELSGGQKRRVAIAGVLAMEPEVLILDEPTAGLDPEGRDEILDAIYELYKEKRMTILLVSHSMEDVARFATRIVVMNRGEKWMDDTPEKVFSQVGKLEQVGLSAPQITYLMKDLSMAGVPVKGLPLTVTQAVQALKAAYFGGEGAC